MTTREDFQSHWPKAGGFSIPICGINDQISNGNWTTLCGIVEIPSAEGCGIRKFSRVVMRAGMEAKGHNVSLNDHEGGSSIPLAEVIKDHPRWNFPIPRGVVQSL